MWEPALGGMNGCGTTRLGASKVFVAFKSEPLVTWEFVTLLGVNPCQSTSNSEAHGTAGNKAFSSGNGCV